MVKVDVNCFVRRRTLSPTPASPLHTHTHTNTAAAHGSLAHYVCILECYGKCREIYLASLGLNRTIGATFSAAYVARLTASRPAGEPAVRVYGTCVRLKLYTKHVVCSVNAYIPTDYNHATFCVNTAYAMLNQSTDFTVQNSSGHPDGQTAQI